MGVGRGDPAEHEAERLADKVATLRVFADDDGKMNLALADVGGAVLVVSQFTLYGDVRKGRRPSWTAADDPERAAALVEAFAAALEAPRRPGGARGVRRRHAGRARATTVRSRWCWTPPTCVVSLAAGGASRRSVSMTA